MGGGLMQLVAYGAQDVYLTGSPQITFFKLVYRRHTNFAVESIEQTFNGTPGFGKKASATISRNGDLITGVFLQVTVPELVNGADGNPIANRQLAKGFMHRFLAECEIEIGGQRIDKHYSHFYDVCDELTTPAAKQMGYNKMVGKVDQAAGPDTDLCKDRECTFYLPLRFWFNNNPGLALPLIALQYHEVKLQMTFASLEKCVVDNSSTPIHSSDVKDDISVSLWVDYVYLDTDERRRFAQASHEYLIEQLQYTGTESYTLGTNVTSSKVRLNFNHPTKELMWFLHKDYDTTTTKNDDELEYLDYVDSAKLLLNGHERFNSRPGSYFRLVVPYQCHTKVPAKNVYCYSFAIKPEEHQPSGSCNFSRIDNASLHLDMKAKTADEAVKLTVYAISYNILRIVSGMGGLAYSN